MANVFISHAGADIDWAEQIHQWLSADNHDSFLDRHKDDGIPVGVDWQQRIFERLRWADAFVCVVTPSYTNSVWCAAEVAAARALGSEILPIRASSERFPDEGRLLHTAVRLISHSRHLILRLCQTWPWAHEFADAFNRALAIP